MFIIFGFSLLSSCLRLYFLCPLKFSFIFIYLKARGEKKPLFSIGSFPTGSHQLGQQSGAGSFIQVAHVRGRIPSSGAVRASEDASAGSSFTDGALGRVDLLSGSLTYCSTVPVPPVLLIAVFILLGYLFPRLPITSPRLLFFLAPPPSCCPPLLSPPPLLKEFLFAFSPLPHALSAALEELPLLQPFSL